MWVRDVEILDYPMQAAIRSLFAFSNEIVILEAHSIDNTLELLLDLQEEFYQVQPNGRFVILRHPWALNRSTESKLRTRILRACTSEWIWRADADEVVPSKTAKKIIEISKRRDKNYFVFKFRHFFGVKAQKQVIDTKWYQERSKLTRRNQKVRFIARPGCSHVAVGVDNIDINTEKFYARADVQKVSAFVNHYGWCRDAEAMGKKLKKQFAVENANYRSFRNKRYIQSSFVYNPGSLKTQTFAGSHPKVIVSWIKRKKKWKFNV